METEAPRAIWQWRVAIFVSSAFNCETLPRRIRCRVTKEDAPSQSQAFAGMCTNINMYTCVHACTGTHLIQMHMKRRKYAIQQKISKTKRWEMLTRISRACPLKPGQPLFRYRRKLSSITRRPKACLPSSLDGLPLYREILIREAPWVLPPLKVQLCYCPYQTNTEALTIVSHRSAKQ